MNNSQCEVSSYEAPRGGTKISCKQSSFVCGLVSCVAICCNYFKLTVDLSFVVHQKNLDQASSFASHGKGFFYELLNLPQSLQEYNAALLK